MPDARLLSRPQGETTVPIEVFLMVLGAALVHATWNALVKSDGDRLSLIKLMSTTQVGVSLLLIPFVSVPLPDSWPYLMASSVFNTGYMLMLNRAYGTGDLSLVYPFARGVAPLAVAVVSITVLGENLSYANRGAVLLIGLGITSLALTQRPTSLIDLRPILFALATGAFIAAYTIVDGLGARAAGSAHSYMIWLSLVTSLLIIGCAHWLQQGRSFPVAQRTRIAGVAAGIMSYGSSWIVIWALTLAPLALVSALRETGVVFAVIIGVVVLKEPVSLSRLASVAMTLFGTTILKLGR
jgi:drug/metabolite transporter (DMT)-like permease